MRQAEFEDDKLQGALLRFAISTARRFGLCASIAQDVCQDVWVKFVGREGLLERVESESFLFTAVKHQLIDLSKSAARNAEIPVDMAASGKVNAEEIAIENETRSRTRAIVAKALARMRGRRRRVMEFWVNRELESGTAPSYQEIAELFGMTDSAAAPIITRARKDLIEACLAEGVEEIYTPPPPERVRYARK